MNKTIKNYLGIALIIASVVFAYSIASFMSAYSHSVGSSSRSFSVSGEGKVTAVPDVAQFTFSIITEGNKDLASLQEKNTTKANKVIEFIKGKNVDAKDIKTQQFSVQPRYQYSNCFRGEVVCPPPEIVGYTINQTVQVKVRNFTDVGDILSGVIKNGANSVSQLSFTVDDRTKFENEAMSKAIAQAKEKAKAVAGAGGFRLGKLLSVSTSNTINPRPMQYGVGGGGFAVSESKTASPTIEPGSQEVKINATLTYEIK